MKYVFVSDIHGCYTKLIEALSEVNFDKHKDTIVSLGDAFDRGPDSKKVLEFLMGCPNRILVWGNHDLRLQELVYGASVHLNDFFNGVHKTFLSFTNEDTSLDIKDVSHHKFEGLVLKLKNNPECGETFVLLKKYFDECCFAVELDTVIGTHAWLPRPYELPKEYWKEATPNEWIDATWSEVPWLAAAGCFADKQLIVGHWHAWRLDMQLNQAGGHHRVVGFSGVEDELTGNDMPVLDCTSYITKDFVAIDGCSNYEFGGRVNAYVVESYGEVKKF